MSCLLKQWLVIKCTKDALHLRQCTGMYVYKIYIDYLIILINNMQIVTFLFCIDPIIYESDGQGRGVLIWMRCGCLLGGGCLLQGKVLYLRKYDMCLFLCGTLFLISAYFSSLKNICKKHFDITCFLLLFRNKNKPVFVLQNLQCGHL